MLESEIAKFEKIVFRSPKDWFNEHILEVALKLKKSKPKYQWIEKGIGSIGNELHGCAEYV